MNPEEINSQSHVLTETLLDERRLISLRLHGYSMYPTLREGDKGIIEKCNPDEIKPGDIIVFNSGNKYVGHRLVEIRLTEKGRVFITRGDKNLTTDEPFGEKDLIGKMISFERKGRTRKMNNFRMKYRKLEAMHFSKPAIPFYNLMLKLKHRFGELTSRIRPIGSNIRSVSAGSGKIFMLNALVAILQGVVPFVIIVCIKSLIDELTRPAVAGLHPYFFVVLAITALFFLLSGVLSEVSSYLSEKLSQSVTRHIYDKLHVKHSALDLSDYENPLQQDKLHRAVQEASFRPVKILNTLLSAIRSVASALFLAGLFISIRWYLVLILLAAIVPGVLVRLWFSARLYRLKASQSTTEREMYYYNRILTGFPFAKELKLFGFSDFFRNRFKTTQDTLFNQKITLRKSESVWGIAAQCFAVVLIFASLGFVSYLKMNGEISIGTVVLFFFAFQRGYSVLNDLFRSFTNMLEDNTFLTDYIDFMQLPAKQDRPGVMPFVLKKEIRFENVSFKYESSKRNALKSVNLTIPAGKTVALVGANGSGKTTLIKLLCGFYQPNAGKVTFDGADATHIGQKAICAHVAAVFQDFALYNIPAIENLALGNIQLPIDAVKAREAASAAGIDSILQNLPNGYDTMLGSLFKTGEELSIGQWQKIAIARAFYRDSELILMDEPSSALDVNSELQVIESLKKLSRNKTAVIVSHRLSTVQWADLIYLFHEGEVIESGSHNELLALRGKYYELFHTANKRVEAD